MKFFKKSKKSINNKEKDIKKKSHIKRNILITLLMIIPFISIILAILFRHAVAPTNEEIIEHVKNMKKYDTIAEYTISNNRATYNEKTKILFFDDHGFRIDFGEELTKLYYEDINLIKKHSKFIQSQNIDIKEISSSHLEFYIINSKDTLYGTSIPYDEGWEVYANGKKIKTQKFHSVFLSFKAPKGKQLIKLKFIPTGFLMGLKISIFSLTYLILLILHQVCKNKRILKFKIGLFT